VERPPTVNCGFDWPQTSLYADVGFLRAVSLLLTSNGTNMRKSTYPLTESGRVDSNRASWVKSNRASRVESNQVHAIPVCFQYYLSSANVKKSTAIENFNLRLWHTITRRRSFRQKRQNMWVHPTGTKRLAFGIFRPAPVQFLPNAGYVISVSIFTPSGIVACLVILN